MCVVTWAAANRCLDNSHHCPSHTIAQLGNAPPVCPCQCPLTCKTCSIHPPMSHTCVVTEYWYYQSSYWANMTTCCAVIANTDTASLGDFTFWIIFCWDQRLRPKLNLSNKVWSQLVLLRCHFFQGRSVSVGISMKKSVVGLGFGVYTRAPSATVRPPWRIV